MNFAPVFVALLLIFPLPLMSLIGTMRQRRALAEERRNFATIRRISRGQRWGR